MLRADCPKAVIGRDGSGPVGISHPFNLSIQPHTHPSPVHPVKPRRNHLTEWLGDGDGKSFAAIIIINGRRIATGIHGANNVAIAIIGHAYFRTAPHRKPFDHTG